MTGEHGGLLQPIHLLDYALQLFVASCELIHRLLEFRLGTGKIADRRSPITMKWTIESENCRQPSSLLVSNVISSSGLASSSA